MDILSLSGFEDKRVSEERNGLAEVLFDLSALLHNASQGYVKEAGWMPPLCPRCRSPLSGKFASARLVCLRCNKEFELKEVER